MKSKNSFRGGQSMRRYPAIFSASLFAVAALTATPAKAQQTFTARATAECPAVAQRAADTMDYWRSLRLQQSRQNRHRPGIEPLSDFDRNNLRRQKALDLNQLSHACRMFGPTRNRPWIYTFVENR
jgi:hypothetical protein